MASAKAQPRGGFSTGIDLDNILDKFDGQGHRSKVKVTKAKKTLFPRFSNLSEQILIPARYFDVMTSHDVMSQNDVRSKIIQLVRRAGTREVQQHFSVFCIVVIFSRRAVQCVM